MKRIIYVDNFLTGHGHTPTTGSTLVAQFRNEGYTVISTSGKKNKILRLADMIFCITANRKNSFVLIATYSQLAFYFACICAATCRLIQIPYIPCLHGGNLPERIKKSPGLARWYFEHSFTNVAVSGYLKASMIENGWNCIEIPNNIPISNYKFTCREAIKPLLFWARSFHNTYNPELAIKVLHRLRQKYTNAMLIMAGPDKDDGSLDRCRSLVKKLGMEKFVTFTGLLTQKQWTDLSSDSDIFINTTNLDNLPVSIIEAMALGMVIISTNVGGIPYLIDDGKTGMIVPPANEEAFINALEKVLNNNGLAASLSIAAHRKAEQFDWSNVKSLWQDLFIRISMNKTN